MRGEGIESAQGSLRSGRKVTEAVIWRTMAWISAMTSFCGFSTTFLRGAQAQALFPSPMAMLYW